MDGGGAYGRRAARRTWCALLGQKAFLKRVAVTLLTLGAGADPWHFMLYLQLWKISLFWQVATRFTRVFPKSESSLESSQESRHTTSPLRTFPVRSESKCWRGQNLQQRQARKHENNCHIWIALKSWGMNDPWAGTVFCVATFWHISLAWSRLCHCAVPFAPMFPYYDFPAGTMRYRRWIKTMKPWQELVCEAAIFCRSVLHAEIGDRYCSLERSHCF